MLLILYADVAMANPNLTQPNPTLIHVRTRDGLNIRD